MLNGSDKNVETRECLRSNCKAGDYERIEPHKTNDVGRVYILEDLSYQMQIHS